MHGSGSKVQKAVEWIKTVFSTNDAGTTGHPAICKKKERKKKKNLYTNSFTKINSK